MKQSLHLPIEVEPVPSHSRWWLAFTLAVGALVLLNAAFIALGVCHTPRHEEHLLQAKWNLASNPKQSFDWIVVGDSSGALGIDPDVLAKKLSGSCINLCTFGSMGTTGDLWNIEQYLRNHKPPRGVIVVHAANVWAGQQNDAFYQYAAAIPENTPKLFGRLLMQGARPSELYVSLRYRDYVPITMLKDRFRSGLGWTQSNEVNAATIQELSPNGAMRLQASQANPKHVNEESLSYLASLSNAQGLDWHNRLALNRLVDLARENNFGLFVANGPIAMTIRNSTSFDDSLVNVEEELATLARSQPQTICVLPKWFAFPPEQMENTNHVVGSAVDTYTEMLASEIVSSLRFEHFSGQD